MDDGIVRWTEAHYHNLGSQTNIYTLSMINGLDGLTNSKALVSSINSEVVTIEYERHNQTLQPKLDKLQLSHLPGDAEIISLDVFEIGTLNPIFVLAVTFLKVNKSLSNSIEGQFLNFYVQLHSYSDFRSITENCQHCSLNFTPYILTHTRITINNTNENVAVLSGSDCQVHVYQQNPITNQFGEINSSHVFPEFRSIRSCVLWMDFAHPESNKNHRLTAIGEQSGQVSLHIVSITETCVLKTCTTTFDGPITTVLFFNSSNPICDLPEVIKTHDMEKTHADGETNLLVIPSLECSVVYQNVVGTGFDSRWVLPDSNRYDIPMCATVADVNFDGQQEVLVGTYGQMLLAYKFYPFNEDESLRNASDSTSLHTEVKSDVHRQPSRICNNISDKKQNINLNDSSGHLEKSESDQSSKDALVNDDDAFDSQGSYKLLWKRGFSDPIMAVNTLDIMGDGVDEIIIATHKGIHVLQPDLERLSKLCEARLERLNYNLVLHQN